MLYLATKTTNDLEEEKAMRESNVLGENANIKAYKKVVIKKQEAYNAADKALDNKRAETAKFKKDVLSKKKLAIQAAGTAAAASTATANDDPKTTLKGEIRTLTSALEAARSELQTQEAVLNGENGMRVQETTLKGAVDKAIEELGDSEDLLVKMKKKREWIAASAAADEQELEAQRSAAAAKRKPEAPPA
ncbi:hypothetical protein FJTKL_00919 [Diaporthe vaccinii]|uniref:Uncharacterized protein n=1 Tax=Diaporthe vaccinii TaxID=105482 RepID=A0ABR4E1W0_9PEZI